jgi:hypothetical protein
VSLIKDDRTGWAAKTSKRAKKDHRKGGISEVAILDKTFRLVGNWWSEGRPLSVKVTVFLAKASPTSNMVADASSTFHESPVAGR